MFVSCDVVCNAILMVFVFVGSCVMSCALILRLTLYTVRENYIARLAYCLLNVYYTF